MKRNLLYLLMVALGGCLHRYVDPPLPVEEGAFFVHVVKAPDESLPKLLTWYTGTTLSQEMVLRYNPNLTQREIKVGDRVVIPIELVANANPYGTSPQAGQTKAPNLLMGESAPAAAPTPFSVEKPRPSTLAPTVPPVSESLPALTLETFGDEMNTDKAEQGEWAAPRPIQHEGKVKQLQQEIADKQRELQRLQASQAPAAGEEDMRPPGLLKEFEGS